MPKSTFTLLTFVSINLLRIIPWPNRFIFHNSKNFEFFLFFEQSKCLFTSIALGFCDMLQYIAVYSLCLRKQTTLEAAEY